MAKILLVEDDSNLRDIYETRIQAEGYETVTAKDGEEALAVIKETHPDLIITDAMMPHLSGLEMIDIIRNTPETSGIKVIMLTALGQSDDRDRAKKLGADRYLVKSQVTLEDIISVTHDLLGDTPESTPTANTPPEIRPVHAEVPVAAEPASDAALGMAAIPTPPTPPPAPQPAVNSVETLTFGASSATAPAGPVPDPSLAVATPPPATPAPTSAYLTSAPANDGSDDGTMPSLEDMSDTTQSNVNSEINDIIAHAPTTPAPLSEVSAPPLVASSAPLPMTPDTVISASPSVAPTVPPAPADPNNPAL